MADVQHACWSRMPPLFRAISTSCYFTVGLARAARVQEKRTPAIQACTAPIALLSFGCRAGRYRCCGSRGNAACGESWLPSLIVVFLFLCERVVEPQL